MCYEKVYAQTLVQTSIDFSPRFEITVPSVLTQEISQAELPSACTQAPQRCQDLVFLKRRTGALPALRAVLLLEKPLNEELLPRPALCSMLKRFTTRHIPHATPIACDECIAWRNQPAE